jgi:hypothetical protein
MGGCQHGRQRQTCQLWGVDCASWFGFTRHLTLARPPTPLAERENYRPFFKKSNAHFSEVQEPAIATKAQEFQSAQECCSFFPQSGIRMMADENIHRIFPAFKKRLAVVPCVP